MDKNHIVSLDKHLARYGYGEAIFYNESMNYVYAAHRFDNIMCFSICRKDLAGCDTRKLELFLTKIYPYVTHIACICDISIGNCKRCSDEIYNHVSTNEKFQRVLLLG